MFEMKMSVSEKQMYKYKIPTFHMALIPRLPARSFIGAARICFYVLVFIGFVHSKPTHAQDSTYFRDTFGTGQKDLDLVLRGLDVEHGSYTFRDDRLIGKRFHFKIKEYRNGELAEEKDLIEGKSDNLKLLFTYASSQDSFLIQSFARAIGPSEISMKLIFNGGISNESQFTTPVNPNKPINRYSLRSDYYDMQPERGRQVPVGEYFPFLVYAPPFRMEDGWFGYICSNPIFKEIPPEEWGDVSGLSHYVVVELKIEEAE